MIDFDDKDVAIMCLSLIAIICVCFIIYNGDNTLFDKFSNILIAIISAIAGLATGKK